MKFAIWSLEFEIWPRSFGGNLRSKYLAYSPNECLGGYFLTFLFLFLSCSLLAQEDSNPPSKTSDSSIVNRKVPVDSIFPVTTSDSLFVKKMFSMDSIDIAKADTPILKKKKKKILRERQWTSEEITIENYKIISYQRDTTYLDTTLTIQKEYRYNYLRRDDFELMPFANVGQPYNKLGVDFKPKNMYPELGARTLHYNYMEVQDIDYYNVATPMTELFFKTTFEEGQLLDGMLTFNTSPRLNFSLAYKGFRSFGQYQFDQAESGNFRTTTNYVTKNGRYSLRAHVAAQDIETEENGGLVNKEEQFESKNPDFTNRVKIDVRFNDANNKILGKRYYLDHLYKLIRKEKDSSNLEKTSLGIGHQFNYETKFYTFNQTASNAYFGDAIVPAIQDRANLKTMYNEVNAEFYNVTLGRLRGSLSLYNYNYFFNSTLITEGGQLIPNKLQGEEIAVGAAYEKRIKGFELRGEVKYNLSGNLGGNTMDASAAYLLNDRHKISVSAHASSQMPNFNFLLYQSDYEGYNWLNLPNFEKEQVYGLRFKFASDSWGDLEINYTTLDNYTYFANDLQESLEERNESQELSPFQENNVLNHTKIKYNKEFKLGGFALNNTVMYQNVSQANQVLNVPQLVTRNTLYFSSDVFKKAMYLQTGVTLKYFTSYNMDAYNPLLGEFYLQNDEKLGGYPMLDFFINAKIQQTRIYLKAEHFNSGFGETSEFYSAPNYPYRDFVIRFGLVWNFFS